MGNPEKRAAAIVDGSYQSEGHEGADGEFRSTFSQRIWTNQVQLRSDLAAELTRGFILGENPRAMARRLNKVMNTGRFNCERLMRTELAHVQIEAQMQSYEANGYDEFVLIAEPGACDICRALNGRHFKVSKYMPGENAPPMHPNCRCSTAAYMDRKAFDEWLKEVNVEKPNTISINGSNIKITGKQFGKKAGKHCQDYGLSPNDENDRAEFLRITQDIIDHYDEKFSGEWRGQSSDCDFYIKGNDVVIVNVEKEEYITTMKGGVNNARVKKARRR